jgi:cysteine desulfurase
MARAYLDNNATTPVAPEVVREMNRFLTDHFGNASSIHQFGQTARAAVESARLQVADLIGADPNQIVFTCGGTEADNTAVIGGALSRKNFGNHIITTRIEHPAVLKSCEFLSEIGFEVSYLGCNPSGQIEVSEIERTIQENTTLISVMAANNETGSIQPVKEIAELAREKGILYHTDAVQLVGKLPVDVQKLSIDLLSLSAHKFHGPKGVGALFIKEGVDIPPMMLGGGQEQSRRGGTENVAGIVGLGKACELAKNGTEYFNHEIRAMRDRLETSLLSQIPNSFVNGDRNNRMPHVMNLSFEGVHGEAILVALDSAGIAVSTGAACHSGSVSPSHVLTAMNLPEERIASALRISLGRLTSNDEISYASQIIPKVVSRARKATGL